MCKEGNAIVRVQVTQVLAALQDGFIIAWGSWPVPKILAARPSTPRYSLAPNRGFVQAHLHTIELS